MKNSIKTGVIAIALSSFFAFGAHAQNNSAAAKTSPAFRLSVGPEFALPINNLSNAYSWGLGGSAQGELKLISEKLYVTLNAGYLNFFKDGDIQNNSVSDLSLIPLKAGLKYFPIGNLYLQGEAGASFLTDKTKANTTRSALFAYSPQIGYQFPLNGNNLIDAGIRFESNAPFVQNGPHNNFFGLRLAYSFGL